jgi:hypothetical protein
LQEREGRLYLDRDPYLFSSLLNWLATNGSVEPNKSVFDTEMFNKELVFWGIDRNSVNWSNSDFTGSTHKTMKLL